jgi:hypothetical protein
MRSAMAAMAALCLAGAVGCSSGKRDVEAPGGGGGVPCAQEIALECGDGMIDACLVDPAAETHVCVAAPDEQAEGGLDGEEGMHDPADIEDAPDGGE